MCTPLLREFPTERERVGWVDSACYYAHERFVFLRHRSRHFFQLQDIRGAVLVGNYRFHHRFFTSPERDANRKEEENPNRTNRRPHGINLACDCVKRECLILVRRVYGGTALLPGTLRNTEFSVLLRTGGSLSFWHG